MNLIRVSRSIKASVERSGGLLRTTFCPPGGWSWLICPLSLALLVTFACKEAPVISVETSRSAEASAPSPQEKPTELATLDLPLTVDEAYAAIPHRRTPFRFDESPMDAVDSAYLRACFYLIDQGTRARVTAHRDLYHKGFSASHPVEQYDALIGSFRELRPPLELEDYGSSILEALENQRAVFVEWEAQGEDFPLRDQIGRHPRVGAASTALRRAYGLLMAKYGAGESASNRDALFDYHCALDFL